jgi:hypothetical protein
MATAVATMIKRREVNMGKLLIAMNVKAGA